MPGIDEEGFLSAELVSFQNIITQKYTAYLDVARQINAFCHQAKNRFSIDASNGQHLVAMALLIKVLNDAQTVVLLTERGLLIQARIILRSGLEALFLLANACQNPGFYKAYLHDAELNRLKIMRAIARNNTSVLAEFRAQITDDFLREVAGEINESGLKMETFKSLADSTGHSATYDGVYRFLCLSAHNSARALEHYFEIDETGEAWEFTWGPTTDNLHPEIGAAALLMVSAMHEVNKLFDLGLEPDLERFKEEVVTLRPPSSNP